MFGKRFQKTLGALAVVVLLAGVAGAGFAAWPAESGGGTQEDINVHGHWMIEVSNPDGTLVERREFDNAFDTQYGAINLAKVLTRQRTVAYWQIELTSLNFEPYFMYNIQEANDPTTPAHNSKNLVVELIESGDDTGTIVLSGIATAHQDGKISYVSTKLLAVGPDNAPSDTSFTGTIWGSNFTKFTLSPGVDVTEGQQVAVTVFISFS